MKTAEIAMYKSFIADAAKVRKDLETVLSSRLFSRYSPHLEQVVEMRTELLERADQLGILSVYEDCFDVIQVHLDEDVFHAFQFENITEETIGDFIHLHALNDDIAFTTCFEINEKTNAATLV